MYKTVGKYIREARKNKNLSLKDAAKLIGISRSFLSRLECGVYNLCKNIKLNNIAEVYGLTIEEIKQHDDDEKNRNADVNNVKLFLQSLSRCNDFNLDI